MSGVKRNIQEIYGGGGHNGNGLKMSDLNGGGGAASSAANLGDSLAASLSGGAGNGLGNNGNGSDPNTNQELKKSRLDTRQQQEASRVVHLRNIPHQLSEQEVVYLGLSFGLVKNVLFLRSKNQAFLEFDALSEAQLMIQHFAQTPATFSGKKIFVQYSNHQELQTDPNNSSNLAAQAALAEAVQLHRAAKMGGKSTVLRATVLNMIYPVTLDVLNQIFSKFGAILKMITFNKNDKFQALIQMKDAVVAQNAKQALHGQNIYNGCCTLQIDYSKLTTLEVRFNNDKSRDFTNLLLPSGDSSGGVGGGAGMGMEQGNGLLSQPGMPMSASMHSLNGAAGGQMNQMSSMQSYQHQQQQQQQQHQHQSLIGQPPGMYGNSMNSSNSGGQSHNSVGYSPSGISSPYGQGAFGQMSMLSQQQQQHHHHHSNSSLASTPSSAHQAMHQNQLSMQHQSMGVGLGAAAGVAAAAVAASGGVTSPVLLVSNLSEE
jgi:hypothetical protein